MLLILTAAAVPFVIRATQASCTWAEAVFQQKAEANSLATTTLVFTFIHSHKGARPPNLSRKVEKVLTADSAD